MIPTSNAYKQQLIAGNRNYVVKAEMTLVDGTSLTLANPQIWEQGVVLNNSISSDSSFDIGTAIIGNLTLVIDNITGFYNTFDFVNARIVLYMGVTNDVDEHDDQVYYRIGFYVVDDTDYNGSLITLDCLDNMTWFDVPFSEVGGISYPTTAGQLIADICSHVGVTLGTPHFQNYTTSISVEAGEWLAENDVNCREVLQYVAQKCCCYCKINTAGELVLTWYDKSQIIGLTSYDGGSYSTTTTPYSDGDALNGGRYYWNGSQYVWEQGDNADGGTFTSLQEGAWLTNNFEMNVATDDIVVTGCRVRSTSGDDQYDELWVDTTLELTHERYVLVIENNPLIIASEAGTVANLIGSILAGLPIRAFSATSLSDFSIETGDMVRITDFRGNIYYTWITSLTFTINNSENFSCGAESVKKRAETRFSEAAKTLAEAKQNANKMLTDYDNAVKAMNELAQDAIGYNIYQYEIGGSTVTWLYSGSSIDTTDPEHPAFPNSANVFKISGDGVFISNDGGVTYTQGYDANSGTAILSLIYAIGINCDWIKAGTLTLGGYDDKNGVCSVRDASDAEKVRLDKNGLTAIAGSIDGKLTIGENGEVGSYGTGMNAACLKNGSLGITADRGTSWCGLAFGKEAATRTGWGNAICALWNGGNSGGGFHVINGTPANGNSGTFIALKYNVLQFWRAYVAQAWLDESGFQTASDRNRKKNIKELATNSVRKFFNAVKPSSFKYRDGDENTHYGIVAQELEDAFKQADLETDAVIKEAEDSSKFVNYAELHGLELAGIKDLYKQIEELKSEVAELKARVK